MIGQIVFAVVMLAVFVGWMFVKPGKSIFDK
jgi:hypothetical protein